jgi:uncharacterized phage protein gp47/JayE
MITIPTMAEIKAQLLNDYQAQFTTGSGEREIDAKKDFFINTLATVQSALLYLAYKVGLKEYQQIFSQTQDTDELLKEGERFGIYPKQATKALVTAGATGRDGTILTAGLEAVAGENFFTITESVRIENGRAVVSLTANEVGELDTASFLTLVQAVSGADNEMTVLTWLNGTDDETTEDFRLRVTGAKAQRPQGGAIPDYVKWALEVPGLVRVMVKRTQPGTVTVYAITSQTGDNRIPSEEKLLELEEHLLDPLNLPLGVENVIAGRFTEKLFYAGIEALQPDTVDLRENFKNVLEAYLWERFPRQYEDERDPTDRISYAEINALLVQAGAQSFTLRLGTAEGLDDVRLYTLAYNELAKLGGIEWMS